MLDPKLIPSRLLEQTEKPSLVIAKPDPPSRFRVLYLIRTVTWTFLGIGWLFLRRRLTNQLFAMRLRAMCESLGGLWIKFAQLMSLRSDIFPREFSRPEIGAVAG